LRDIVVSKPYAILYYEEVNSLISQIESVAEDACALRQAVENARRDGYFPIVMLPVNKYEAALSLLRMG
jgi:hypothetical protein